MQLEHWVREVQAEQLIEHKVQDDESKKYPFVQLLQVDASEHELQEFGHLVQVFVDK